MLVGHADVSTYLATVIERSGCCCFICCPAAVISSCRSSRSARFSSRRFAPRKVIQQLAAGYNILSLINSTLLRRVFYGGTEFSRVAR